MFGNFTKRFGVLVWMLGLLLTAFELRAEITFTPAAPSVVVGEQISLSVSGTVGEVEWDALSGWIEGTGISVTYTAPDQPGWDVVTVLDSEANIGTLKIEIKAQTQDFSPENALWEVWTNRDDVRALAYSQDRSTIWVGTMGGLEKRNALTGELERVYLNTDGLPDNDVRALLSDEQGGVWVGTWEGGLAHLKADDNWDVFNKDNSDLPDNSVKALLSDAQGGVWMGTWGRSLAHLKADGNWEVFNKDNSDLPDNSVNALLSDDQGGVWVGTWGGDGGLAHLKADGSWEVFNTDNSGLPSDSIYSLLSDNQGGIWVGTDGGLAHLKAYGNWKVFNTSGLPDDVVIRTLLSDEQGEVWVGTYYDGLAHLKADGNWEWFDTDNSGMPSNWISALLLDDQGGFWVGIGSRGLARLKADGNWEVFKKDNNMPADNWVKAFILDDQGGVSWVGTDDGLAHLKADGNWEVFKEDNSDMPDNNVEALLLDDQGEIWVGTWGGIAHLKADGNWEVFNKDNSDLPDNSVIALLSDDQGGVWVGTWDGGIAHLKADGNWEVFNTDNSSMPYNYVWYLISDEQGGAWVGTFGGGLAHLKADGNWEVFNRNNSDLPDDRVRALSLDDQGGVWVGTDSRGIAHLKADGHWEVFNRDNSDLPDNKIIALLSDDQGGVWVGTESDGLAHLKADGNWEWFDTDKSGLPYNYIWTLVSDDQGGVWVGTHGGGLAHLTFGEQQAGKRAAIIITGGPNTPRNELWDTATSISNYTYKMLNGRGFVNTEIYYLSPQDWADFNGDGFNDRIVDAPRPQRQLMIEDVHAALEWAKEQGQLDQPLYLFFIGHGGGQKLQLADFVNLEAAELKALLDDYQAVTGSKVVLVVDACHSGSFMPTLAAENRAVLTSSKAEEKSFFFEKQGWSRFLASSLFQGMHFLDAFEYAFRDQEHMLGKNLPGFQERGLSQTPGFDDNGDGVYTSGQDGPWLKQIKINGDYVTADLTLAVTGLTESASLAVGEALSLRARASIASGRVERVWSVIRPPKMNLVIDSNGTPILAYPRAMLSPNAEDGTLWEGSWSEAVYNGDYEITFYAEDDAGNIASSEETVMITVSGGLEPPTKSVVEIVLEKDRYQRGESFEVSLIEHLNWGYDLYAAVVLPDGQFVTLSGENEFAPLNQPDKWSALRDQGSHIRLIQLTLPETLPTGRYCLYGILSSQNGEVLKNSDHWVWGERCFEVF